MVTRVDRLARSIKDLQDIVHALNEEDITHTRAGLLRAMRWRQLFRPRSASLRNWGSSPRPKY